MPETARLNRLEDPFNPHKAIAKSAQLLRDLNRHFGNLGLAAAAYNAGPGRVRGWVAAHRLLPGETRAYVRLVTGRTIEEWTSGQNVSLNLPAPKDLPCDQGGEVPIPPNPAVPPSEKTATPKPWGVEVVGGPASAKALARYREWLPKYAAIDLFFRVTELSNEDEPIGGEGVPLTPGQSIAVDGQHEYGTPLFIEALLIDSKKLLSPFHRLVIAQDTGSAIVGPVRADVYWGARDDAGRIASRIRELDIMEPGGHMPPPLPRPRGKEVAVNKKADVVHVHRRVATKSVQPAGPARLQPPRTRCSSCVLQPNQVRETVGECCGPRNSGKGPQTQKPDKREFAARLRIGPERPHHSLPEPSNKRAPLHSSPPQAAKPIIRSSNL